MEGPDGIQLGQMLGATERGTLWRAMRQRKDDRIVRIIDPRFSDLRFRQSLANLHDRQYPRMLRIVGEGWAGVHFYVEYRVDSPWETLDAYFKKLHWRLRLAVLEQICEVLPQWNSAPVHPLGLNGQNIIMLHDVGHWFPWLLPCPVLPCSSPCDLFEVQPSIISTLAPEFIRGVHLQDRPLDIYALGTLTIHALGGVELQQAKTDETRIEAQACGALLPWKIQSSAIENFLHQVEPLKRLAQAIQRYTHILPEARPQDARTLRAACVSAFNATDPFVLASDLIQQKKSREALRRLDWGFKHFGDTLQGRLLAADICEKIEELLQALAHLDRAVLLDDSHDPNLRWRRTNLRWLLYQTLPPLNAGETDPEGGLLLQDTIWFKIFPHSLARQTVPYLMAAAVHRRRQDLAMAAQELYEAALEIDQTDMMALWLYGECYKDIGNREATAEIVHEAHRRLERMTINEMMEITEAERWRIKFDALLQP